MHDDDEARFPRITLSELLGGIFKRVASGTWWLILVVFLVVLLAQSS